MRLILYAFMHLADQIYVRMPVIPKTQQPLILIQTIYLSILLILGTLTWQSHYYKTHIKKPIWNNFAI